MGKVPLPVLKKLECQARQNLSTINFTAAFAQISFYHGEVSTQFEVDL